MKPIVRIPPKLCSSEIEKFFESEGLGHLISHRGDLERSANDMIQSDPYPPDLQDLYRLYQFIVLNKRLTVLEFGCGWSSLVMAHALRKVRDSYADDVSDLRRSQPFYLSVVDNEEKFLTIAKNRIALEQLDNVEFSLSDVVVTTFNGRLCTQYSKLPQVNPDFIYLDGPDQFNVKGAVNSLSIAHQDFMPMASDLLLIEHFLTPGTILVVDGRTANARFLERNFQRNWTYKHETQFDQTIFLLDEEPLGEYNRRQLDFYLRAD